MEAATASILVSCVAAVVSVVALIRTRKSAALAAQMQEWTWRQKVGDELSEVSYLLTQNELANQREQRRNDTAERLISILAPKRPNHPTIADAKLVIAESRAIATRQQKEYAKYRKTMVAIWQSTKPSAAQLAELQQVRSGLREALAKLMQLEPIQEANLKQLTESASSEA